MVANFTVLEKIFGTDGVRGNVGGNVVCESFFSKLGHALEVFLAESNLPLRIVIGSDGRSSAVTLRCALMRGFCREFDVFDVGVMSTPAIAAAVRFFGATTGISITASHNSSCCNGAKFFDSCGNKWSKEIEARVEKIALRIEDKNFETHAPSRVYNVHNEALENYKKLWLNNFNSDALEGVSIALDLSNGASAKYGAQLFESIGAKVFAIGMSPDGKNINENCGSEHPNAVSSAVLAKKADWGLATDGDGDRALLCDNLGNVIAGEHLLALLACVQNFDVHPQQIITTFQANTALDSYLLSRGINVLRTDVGDRNVAEMMIKHQCKLGGEPSGHVLFSNCGTVADGLLTGAFFIEAATTFLRQCRHADWRFQLRESATYDIDVAEKFLLLQAENFQKCKACVERRLGEYGRVFARYSGTESKLRILVEAEHSALANESLKELAAAYEQDIACNSGITK